MSERSEDNAGLLEYLAGLIEPIGAFKVVSRREKEQTAPGSVKAEDLPIIEVISDESDDEICMVRKEPEVDSAVALNLESFYRELQAEVTRHPNFKLVVSEWFQIDEDHRGRIDIALAGVEVDEDAKVLRLMF
jgi:hypothetical protein